MPDTQENNYTAAWIDPMNCTVAWVDPMNYTAAWVDPMNYTAAWVDPMSQHGTLSINIVFKIFIPVQSITNAT